VQRWLEISESFLQFFSCRKIKVGSPSVDKPTMVNSKKLPAILLGSGLSKLLTVWEVERNCMLDIFLQMYL
jgi:hypothetical protein